MTDASNTSSASERRLRVASCIEASFDHLEYSDMEVHCGERFWCVHRVVVCAQCPFFHNAIAGEFLESNTKVIHLKEDDPAVVHEMLRFFYSGDYLEPTGAKEDTAHSALVLHVLVHTISDKYDIPTLGQLANEKFAKLAAEAWNTDGFAQAIEELYTGAENGKDEMKKCAVEIAAKQAKQLFSGKYDEFRKVAEGVPRFAAELSSEIVRDKLPQQGMSRYRCPNITCRKTVFLETMVYPFGSNRTCPYCSVVYNQSSWAQNLVQDDQ